MYYKKKYLDKKCKLLYWGLAIRIRNPESAIQIPSIFWWVRICNLNKSANFIIGLGDRIDFLTDSLPIYYHAFRLNSSTWMNIESSWENANTYHRQRGVYTIEIMWSLAPSSCDYLNWSQMIQKCRIQRGTAKKYLCSGRFAAFSYNIQSKLVGLFR